MYRFCPCKLNTTIIVPAANGGGSRHADQMSSVTAVIIHSRDHCTANVTRGTPVRMQMSWLA